MSISWPAIAAAIVGRTRKNASRPCNRADAPAVLSCVTDAKIKPENTMIKRTLMSAVAGVGLWLGNANLDAAPFEPKKVPEGAKWVLHVDMDALRITEVWKLIDGEIAKNAAADTKLGEIEQFTGIKFPEGLHDVTLYGLGFSEDAAVITISAGMDQGRLIGFLQQNPNFKSEKHGEKDVFTWIDESGKRMYGTFYDDKTAAISQSSDAIKTFIDTRAGVKKGLSNDSPLAAGAKPGLVAYMAGKDLAQLKEAAQNPQIQEAELIWFGAEERGADVALYASLTTKTADTANQLRMLAEGGKALLALQMKDPKTDPSAKMLGEMLQRVTTKVEGSTLSADGKVSLGVIRKLMDMAAGAKITPPPAAADVAPPAK
jgi:hypothetical protein